MWYVVITYQQRTVIQSV